MSTRLLLSVKDALIRFSEEPVFENLAFNIHENSRIALVGKNGAGKSTLMNIITGNLELDDGERWEEPGITIGYLHQDITPKKGQSVYQYILQEIKEEDRELHSYKVDIVAQNLELDVNRDMTHLSGGQLRRAGLARALVEEPDILLLDEPTNHLDMQSREVLLNALKTYEGTILFVSHDRHFLKELTRKVIEVDKSKVTLYPGNYDYYLNKKSCEA